tara:strand:- start:249 stop:593 length:345 start_codon:yes stop_codon:yes gene_type:complete
MKKLIDIPDSMVKEIKVLAAQSDKAVKHYLEDAILKEVQQGNYNELANYVIRDGQDVRPFWNYLALTFEALKDHTFNDLYPEHSFKLDEYVPFLEHVKGTIDWMIDIQKNGHID